MVDWGKFSYQIYKSATRLATPIIYAYVRYRILIGLEHPSRYTERLGRATYPRPVGPLLWFHAVSLGEGLSAIPVIKYCINQKQNYNVLMTTTAVSAFAAIKDQLPDSVIYQFAPIDTLSAVEEFLRHWNPTAIFLIENELWPNLIMSASDKKIPVALLNGRMSSKSFRRWSEPVSLPLIALMLSRLSLVIPLSTTQAIHFQLLRASPHIINFAGDLKYAVGEFDLSNKEICMIEEFKVQFANRPIWMAASIHKGEEDIILWVHKQLCAIYPNLITILVPRHPQHGQKIIKSLKRQGINTAVRSKNDPVSYNTKIYVVDTLGELRMLYRITPIAVIGGSFLPYLAGHNISEAASFGCAVITGPHVGHFSHMIARMKQINSSSVQQVEGKLELVKVIRRLLSNTEELVECQNAAKEAFITLSRGVVQRVWDLIDIHVLSKQASSFTIEKQMSQGDIAKDSRE